MLILYIIFFFFFSIMKIKHTLGKYEILNDKREKNKNLKFLQNCIRKKKIIIIIILIKNIKSHIPHTWISLSCLGGFKSRSDYSICNRRVGSNAYPPNVLVKNNKNKRDTEDDETQHIISTAATLLQCAFSHTRVSYPHMKTPSGWPVLGMLASLRHEWEVYPYYGIYTAPSQHLRSSPTDKSVSAVLHEFPLWI